MPGYRGHLFLGYLLFILFVFLIHDLDILNFISLFVLVSIFSLLPDIDANNSKIGIFFRVLLIFLIIISLISHFFTLSLIFCFLLLILSFVRHRGFFHTLRSGIILSLPLFYFGLIFFLAGFLSYSGHLVLDRHLKW